MSGQLTGTRGFVDDIAAWRRAATERAPSYHRLFDELIGVLGSDATTDMAVARRFEGAWSERTFEIFYDRPMLFVAALRRDALAEGGTHPLFEALGAREPEPRAVTRAALLAALARESVWEALRSKFVQTNETSRALAWLWPASVVGCGEGARPLALFEIGSAAGLNLVADRLPTRWKTARGDPLPCARAPRALVRRGIDRNPLDPSRDDDASWLRACVWAGESERIERLEAAIAAFCASPALVEHGDVSEAPERLRAVSAERERNAVVIAFQTIVRDYLDSVTRDRYERGMRAWLEAVPPGSALWVELELDHDDPEKRVPIVAHARDTAGALDLSLGVTGYHPVTVAVDEAAVAKLAATFR